MNNGPLISWRRAVGLAALAVYGPFLAMALYALFFVKCSHCKATAWMLLPCAPGLLPFEAARRWVMDSRPGDAIEFAIAFTVSLALAFALAAVVRRGRRLRVAGLAVAVAVFSVFAFCTLGAIRS